MNSKDINDNALNTTFNLSIQWIDSIPKLINDNNCWIPIYIKPNAMNYIELRINNNRYYLHRLSMCIYNNIDYDNKQIDTRHSSNCHPSCFNYNHLSPGTHYDNMQDAVNNKKFYNQTKINCPKCNGPYKRSYTFSKGKMRHQRYCPRCQRRNAFKKKENQK